MSQLQYRIPPALAAALVVTASAMGGPVVYVDDDAAPGGDGSSWRRAFRFLQDALAAAGDPVNGIAEVRVAQGTHRPDRDEANPQGTADREASFRLLDGVALRGGYAGLGAPDPDERDIALHETVLSGDLLGDDGPEFRNNGENSIHVVTASGTDRTALLEGFTITAGNACCAANVRDPMRFGGGLYGLEGHAALAKCSFVRNAGGRGGGLADDTGALVLTECAFIENCGDEGGGMYSKDASPMITGCIFADNTSFRGGGLLNDAGHPTLTDCTFLDNTAADSFAGGALNTTSGSITMQNCLFSGNQATHVDSGRGGGILNFSSPMTVTDCTFRQNTATWEGGAIWLASSGPASTFRNCTFEENAATDLIGSGGAIRVGGGALTFIECTFAANTAPTDGGAIASSGAEALLIDCTFTGNAAGTGFLGGAGAALFNFQGTPTLLGCAFDDNQGNVIENWGEMSMLLMAGCTFRGNSGAGGVALTNIRASATVLGCSFIDNTATDGNGGAVFSRLPVDGDGVPTGEAALAFVNCTFIGNTASEAGGAMYNTIPGPLVVSNCLFAANVAAETGGAIHNEAATPTLSNCTVVGNQAGEGGGGISNVWRYTQATLANCILWNNGPDQVSIVEEASVTMRYCDVQGGWGGPGEANIDADPLFVDPQGPDGVPGTEDDDYRLSPGSPCLDAGINWGVAPDLADLDQDRDIDELVPFDLDRNPRFADDPAAEESGCGLPVIVDMGAYESAGEAVQPLAGDLDGDGDVSTIDLLGLLAAWGPAGGCTLADLTLDGWVDSLDLCTLLDNWE